MVTMAQIGVGYWGPNLLRNLVANKRCWVKRVADLSKERLHYVKTLYPAIEVTEEADQIFQDLNIEAVVISTPASTHFDLAMKSPLEKGNTFLVEKPLAKSVREVEQIAKCSEEKNLW